MAVIIIPSGKDAATPDIPARFREAGATEPGRAIAWAPAGGTEESSFRGLVNRGALVEMRPGTWYLNEEKLAAGAGGQVALLIAGAALVVGGALLLVLR